MNIKIFIRCILKREQEKDDIRINRMKNSVINDLERNWTIEEIRDYNADYLYGSNAYERIVPFTEQSIKLRILNYHMGLFSIDEYKYYYDKLTNTKTLKLSKDNLL